MTGVDDPLSQQLDEPGDAPPPYESVVLEPAGDIAGNVAPRETGRARMSDSQEVIRSGIFGQPHNPAFTIKVVDPVRQGEGVSAFVSYKVISSVTHDGYRSGEHAVIRRFRDFTWLKNRLRSQYQGIIIPALPEKSVVEKYKMASNFIEQRRAALQVFLQRVAAHPILHTSPDLRLFLQSDETEFAIESSRTAAEAGDAAPAASGGAANAARKTLSTAARLFRSLGQSAAGIGAGGTAPRTRQSGDDEESPDYLRLRAYFADLEGHLAEAHRQAERLVHRHATLATALAEFGSAMAALGRAQEEAQGGRAPREFAKLSQQATAAAAVCHRSQEELSHTFEAPLKEFVRWVKSAKKAMTARSDALAARQTARADVDARRSRLSRLRVTPGIAEERVMEAERDVQNANAKAEAAAKLYDGVVERMGSDLERFQTERVVELGYVLRDFAEAEGKAAAEMAKLWRVLAPEA